MVYSKNVFYLVVCLVVMIFLCLDYLLQQRQNQDAFLAKHFLVLLLNFDCC